MEERCRQCRLGKGPLIWEPDSQSFEIEQNTPTISFLGSNVNPYAFSTFSISISVGLQVLAFLTFGSYADYGKNEALSHDRWLRAGRVGIVRMSVFA